MVYRISEKAVIIESGGETILVAESVEYDSDLTIGSTDYTLSPDYVDNYFSSSAIGQSHGFVVSGSQPSFGGIIQRFSFASGLSETWGSDPTLLKQGTGFSSGSDGFIAGGLRFFDPTGSTAPYTEQILGLDTITKFSFVSSNQSAIEVGTFSPSLAFPVSFDGAKATSRSAPSQSSTHGYFSGGRDVSNTQSPVSHNSISKFSFSSVSTQADVGDQITKRLAGAGSSSATHGYTSGGEDYLPPFPLTYTQYNIIDKFPFASDANATDVGDLTVIVSNNVGLQSSASGYSAGGTSSPPYGQINVIQKFPFSSDANATDVGDLTVAKYFSSGSSSSSAGFNVGGNGPNPGNPFSTIAEYTNIEKFPFATDANGTDVGQLVEATISATGHQV